MENTRKREEPTTIDLLELLTVLLRRWKMLLLGLLVGAFLAGGYTYMQPDQYQSSSQLFILSETTSITSLADVQIGSTLSTDFLEIAMSKPILDTVIKDIEEECDVTLTREDVQDMVTVSVKDDTRILMFTATSTDAELACAVSNSIMNATASQIAAIMKSDLPTTVEEAEVETIPLDNGLSENMVKGGLVGLIIMILIFTIPFLLNDKIKSKEDVEKYLEEGVLTIIPIDKELKPAKRHTRKEAGA
ncbi:MAG: Wzz/FepE/Etk N-terminal domain-containing protein [Clostridiales bacterium]|nr:Wzz/FepE/Etk N-terminal domain-containing protein [Clostridiales bacterium]